MGVVPLTYHNVQNFEFGINILMLKDHILLDFNFVLIQKP